MRKLLLLTCLAGLAPARGLPILAQEIPAAVVSDPKPDAANPATMETPDVPSHGARLHAVFYLASGAGPHPTVLLMHGFPGNEKNLDLAYAVRRAGWNVLVPHYRGAWGSEGTFSFTHAIEDTQAAFAFLRAPEQTQKYRVDPDRIVLIGHSMGGFMAAQTAAQESAAAGLVMIAAWNLGPSVLRHPPHQDRDFQSASSRLAGTTPEGLRVEAQQNAARWNYLDLAPALRTCPVLVLETNDGLRPDNQAMVAALRKAGDTWVTEVHMDTDHVFSDHRIALAAAVVEWLEHLGSRRPAK